MNADLSPDLCIIGGGPGGFSLALGAAACGRSVVLVEKGALGGRKLTDSIPRHALLAASRAATFARGAAAFGIAAQAPRKSISRGCVNMGPLCLRRSRQIMRKRVSMP